jgi:parallel beta-helix repeat protein
VVDPANTVLDGQGVATVLALVSTRTADMAVDGVTLQNGVATNGSGGGLYVKPNGGNVSLTNAIVSGNTASSNGGGVYVDGADTVTIATITASDNTARDNNGGGIRVGGADTITIDHATISNNTAGDYGGGLNVGATTVSLTNITISNNSAGGYWGGGGVYVGASTLTIDHATISDNTAYGYRSHGGGATVHSAAVTIDHATISGNSASYGGGLYAWEATTFTLTNTTISDNTAGYPDYYSSGGLWVGATTLTIDHATISNNTAGYGGGLQGDVTTLTLTNAIVSDNAAAHHGGGLNVGASTLTLTNVLVSNNTAGDFGGGVRVWRADTLTLTNNTFSGNTATNNGGGLWAKLQDNSDAADIYNNIFWANDATSGVDLYLNNDGNGDFIRSPVNLFHNDFDHSTIYMKMPIPIDASNLDAQDPGFVDADHDDYHLWSGSPVIDMGDNEAPALPATDLDGNPRIINGVVDMGAYEYQGGGGVPDLTVAPASLDFGSVEVGVCAQRLLTLGNQGTAALVVNAVSSDNAAFTITAPAFPQTLAPAAEVEVTVQFCPAAVGPDSATLRVSSTDPDSPEVDVPCSGEGTGVIEPCDANGDGHVDRRDAWDLLRYLLRDGEPLRGDADCNQDDEINFRDVLAILKESR